MQRLVPHRAHTIIQHLITFLIFVRRLHVPSCFFSLSLSLVLLAFPASYFICYILCICLCHHCRCHREPPTPSSIHHHYIFLSHSLSIALTLMSLSLLLNFNRRTNLKKFRCEMAKLDKCSSSSRVCCHHIDKEKEKMQDTEMNFFRFVCFSLPSIFRYFAFRSSKSRIILTCTSASPPYVKYFSLLLSRQTKILLFVDFFFFFRFVPYNLYACTAT